MKSKLPFQGLKVVELASVLAGPAVGQFFAELGAHVLKIENPKTRGDVTRGWKTQSELKETSISSYYASVNWGKEVALIDLIKERDLFLTHLADADVLLVNFKPGDEQKLKLSYDDLKESFPKLIYACLSGFGADDPRPGFDALIQAESGFMSINGEADGDPLKMPVALVDLLAAHQLKEAILIALLERNQNGLGQKVEASLLDSAVSSLANQASNYLNTGVVPRRMGSEHPNIYPYGVAFTCKNKEHVVIVAGTDRQYVQLCKVLAIDANDKRFLTNPARVQNRKALKEILSTRFAQLDSQKVLSDLHQAGVPAGKVQSLDQVFDIPSVADRLLKSNDFRAVRQVAFRASGWSAQTNLKPPQSLPKLQ